MRTGKCGDRCHESVCRRRPAEGGSLAVRQSHDAGTGIELRTDPSGSLHGHGGQQNATGIGGRSGVVRRRRSRKRLFTSPCQSGKLFVARTLYVLQPLRALPGQHQGGGSEQIPEPCAGAGRTAGNGPGTLQTAGTSRIGMYSVWRVRKPLPVWRQDPRKNATGSPDLRILKGTTDNRRNGESIIPMQPAAIPIRNTCNRHLSDMEQQERFHFSNTSRKMK